MFYCSDDDVIGGKNGKRGFVLLAVGFLALPPPHWFLLCLSHQSAINEMKSDRNRVCLLSCPHSFQFSVSNEVVFPIKATVNSNKIGWNIKYEFVHHLPNRLCSSLWCSSYFSLKSIQCICNVCLCSAPSAASSLCRNRKFSSRYLGRCRNRSNNLSFAGAHLSLMMSLFPLWLCPKRDCQCMALVFRLYSAGIPRWDERLWPERALLSGMLRDENIHHN